MDEVKRPYRSERRRAQAAATRAAIREAAEALFVERGFTATTVREVAARAGVGERTVYDGFPTKTALFEHVVGVAIAGDERPVAVADRDAFRAVLDEPDPERAIAAFVELTAALLERAGQLIMVAIESSGADPDMRRFSEEGAAATRANARTFAESLARRGALSGHPDEASATVFALCSPHVHHLLRVGSGRSAAAYVRWLTDTLRAQLLVADDGT